jgi:hypothetical protein
MSKHHQQQQRHPQQQNNGRVEVAEASIQLPEEQKAEVQVSATPMPQQPQLQAMPVEEKLVTVRPREDIPRCRIGNQWYSFRKGHQTQVTAAVKAHLEEKGII